MFSVGARSSCARRAPSSALISASRVTLADTAGPRSRPDTGSWSHANRALGIGHGDAAQSTVIATLKLLCKRFRPSSMSRTVFRPRVEVFPGEG